MEKEWLHGGETDSKLELWPVWEGKTPRGSQEESGLSEESRESWHVEGARWLMCFRGGRLLSLSNQRRGIHDVLSVRPSSLLIFLGCSFISMASLHPNNINRENGLTLSTSQITLSDEWNFAVFHLHWVHTFLCLVCSSSEDEGFLLFFLLILFLNPSWNSSLKYWSFRSMSDGISSSLYSLPEDSVAWNN